MEGSGKVKKLLTNWAQQQGLEKNNRQQYGNKGGAPLGYSVAKPLVLSKVSAALGLDQAKYLITSAAPISVEVGWDRRVSGGDRSVQTKKG